MDEKTVLRARDFWTSAVLILTSAFFLYQTTDIPFLNTKVAGVDSADWYNSAALVPFGIFGSLLFLGLVLLAISIKDGGAQHALNSAGLAISTDEISRVGCVSLILFFYIFGLVPRVDFILASGLMITCLIWGFHGGGRLTMLTCTGAIGLAALYAMIFHFPRQEWTKPHDDDWVTLVAVLALNLFMILIERHRNDRISSIVRLTPVISLLVPLVLVSTMAFGFRQNVPNRSGLLFSQIEYHYYVTVRPLWQEKR